MVNYCPSDGWEAHLASTEPPESCPQCKGENFDVEADDWICAEALGFCSVECLKKHEEEEAYQFAAASCVKHRSTIYVAEGCGECEDEHFDEYMSDMGRIYSREDTR